MNRLTARPDRAHNTHAFKSLGAGALVGSERHLGATAPIQTNVAFFYAHVPPIMAGCAGTLEKVCRFLSAGRPIPSIPPPTLLVEIVAVPAFHLGATLMTSHSTGRPCPKSAPIQTLHFGGLQ